MKTKTWILIIMVLLLLAAAGCLLVFLQGGQASRAEIWSEGVLLRTLDLSADQELTVETDRGINVITVRDGKVAVTEADCPDQYCRKQGFCNGGAPIVCLPHSLVIRFVGGQGVDGALG